MIHRIGSGWNSFGIARGSDGPKRVDTALVLGDLIRDIPTPCQPDATDPGNDRLKAKVHPRGRARKGPKQAERGRRCCTAT